MAQNALKIYLKINTFKIYHYLVPQNSNEVMNKFRTVKVICKKCLYEQVMQDTKFFQIIKIKQ